MPRKPRVLSSTGIYHIVLRSVNQHIIFEEDSDYQKFLHIMKDCKMKYDIDIYAYCLMDNHIHILLKSPPDRLSTFFQSMETRFVRWYNNQYSRSGHLFQDRFHSTSIEDEKAFLSVLVYIHDNPVKANMCRFSSEYRWSSHHAYYGKKDPLIDPSLAYNVAGTKAKLLLFFAQNARLNHDALYADDHTLPRHFFTDEKAMEIFLSQTGLSSVSEAAFLSKVKRNEYVRMLKKNGLTTRQVSRMMDISETTVKRLCKTPP
ncbi:MAG: transposase [Lachnospiraceae bacterium]|nr:transposase [Lachnospiraceae bacterium]